MTKHDSNAIWAVRDARGLNANEKVFLFLIASRGILKSTRERILGDCGFSQATFYRVIDSLAAKGLVNISHGKYNPVSGKRDQTHYTLNLPALKSLHDSLSENDDSLSENDDSLSENDDSHSEYIKVTVKETMKRTDKETEEEAGVVPTPSLPLYERKQGDEGCLSVEEKSSLVIEEEDAPLDVEPPEGAGTPMKMKIEILRKREGALDRFRTYVNSNKIHPDLAFDRTMRETEGILA